MPLPVRPAQPARPTVDSPPRARLLSSNLVCRTVVDVVAAAFSLDPATLFARSRAATPALARQTAMYLAHTTFALSPTEIGRIYGRDRTTVAHACRRIEDAREDAVFDERLRRCEQRARDLVQAWLRPALRVVR